MHGNIYGKEYLSLKEVPLPLNVLIPFIPPLCYSYFFSPSLIGLMISLLCAIRYLFSLQSSLTSSEALRKDFCKSQSPKNKYSKYPSKSSAKISFSRSRSLLHFPLWCSHSSSGSSKALPSGLPFVSAGKSGHPASNANDV